MKVSKLNEIVGVLVTAGRTDLAEEIVGKAPKQKLKKGKSVEDLFDSNRQKVTRQSKKRKFTNKVEKELSQKHNKRNHLKATKGGKKTGQVSKEFESSKREIL
jgi:hypothetical protein